MEEDNSRELKDRRKHPTPVFSKYTFSGGRRKTVRRARDKKRHFFVDLYSTRLLIAITLLMGLSCMDAYLTLVLIGKGKVVEANPVMAYFLDLGVLPFTAIKFAVTAFSLIILCIFKNIRTTRISLPFAIKIYIIIIAYEVYLISI
jgi:hypothetical protein